ncbi:MAG: energy transducer TonB [Pseudomonadota bacterium]
MSTLSIIRSPQFRQSPRMRIAVIALPAAVITLGLFGAMRSLIVVDDFEPPAQVIYDVTPFIEATHDPEPQLLSLKPIRPAEIDPPPRLPPQSEVVKDMITPIGDYIGAAPADYGKRDFKDMMPKMVGHIPEREILPITPPVPIYPSQAIRRGIEGACEVHLSVSPRGEPFEVDANCTDQVFERAARNAILKVKFAPQIRNGSPVTVRGVVYPLEFRMKP